MSAEKIVRKLECLGFKGFPSCALVEVTHKCNASCPYCIAQGRKAKDLPFEKLDQIFEKLDKSGIITVVITGGEPFLRTDIIRLFDSIFKKQFFEIIIYTNGILLQQEHIHLLSVNKDRIPYIQMSVFSHKAKINDSYFGLNGALEKIIKNGTDLINNGVQVHLSFSVLEINVSSLQETMDFFRKMGFIISHSPLKFEHTQKQRSAIAMSSSKDFFSHYLNQYSCKDKDLFLDQMANFMMKDTTYSGTCRGISATVHIRPDGDIVPCISFPEGIAYGNILEPRPLREILQNSEHYVSMMRGGGINNVCKACRLYAICMPCPARESPFAKGFSVENQQCALAKAIEEELQAMGKL